MGFDGGICIWEYGKMKSMFDGKTATRWGGGLYAGISPRWYHTPILIFNNYNDASVVLREGKIHRNGCETSAVGSTNPNTKFPAQIAVERVRGFDAGLDFRFIDLLGRIAGEDIGIYAHDSITPLLPSGNIISSFLALWFLED
jgi:hypothetical protein